MYFCIFWWSKWFDRHILMAFPAEVETLGNIPGKENPDMIIIIYFSLNWNFGVHQKTLSPLSRAQPESTCVLMVLFTDRHLQVFIVHTLEMKLAQVT